MIDLIKKAMFTGIGVAALTKDKVDEVAKAFVEQGKLSEKEGEKLVDDILTKSRESQHELAKQVEVLVQSAMEKLDVASKEELEVLKGEVEQLKKSIESLQKEGESKNV